MSSLRKHQVTALRTILSVSLEQSHLLKLQRMFLKHSSRPELMYQNQLLMDYANPAEDENRCLNYDSKFEVDYLLHNMYRKLLLPTGDKQALDKAAYASFIKGERKNVRTNKRLRSISWHDVETNTFVFRVQRVISNILGPLNLEKIVEHCRFSSGATCDLSLKKASITDKYAMENPSFTPAAYCKFQAFARRIDGMTGATSFRGVAGNRILTVPKSNKTNRTIAAEPTMNMFFQLGVGTHIRRRLRRFGIDLNDQTINQRLAYEGSLDGSLATIDLENASNSLSYEAVKLLLPHDWFEVLDALRSPYGLLMGRKHAYRMFSSMGNGYTFELESLIFYAICKVAARVNSTISVYGDDIIVEAADCENVIKWLEFFGFSTNRSKTFTVGHFRESCGKHYYFGADVTPFFVRRLPVGFDAFLLHNNIVRWARRYGECTFVAEALEPLRYVHNLIPKDSRLYGPDGYGDGHLLECRELNTYAKYKYSRVACQLQFESWSEIATKVRSNQLGALCASLLGLTKDNELSRVAHPYKRMRRLGYVTSFS